MSEILSAIRLKDKITIASIMAAFAALLAILVAILSMVTADRHSHIYDYRLEMAKDGSFYVAGVCNVNNCENPFFEYKIESGVELLSADSPSCSTEGKKIYSYTYGGLTMTYTEILPKSSHLYDYELIDRNGILYVNGACTVDGCTDPLLFINDVKEITLIGVIPATCFSSKQETYSYVSDGKTGTFSTLVDEYVPHTLNGKPSTDFSDEYGKYPLLTENVHLFPNEGVKCGDIVDGYFVCEVCRQIESVKVRIPQHDYKFDEAKMLAPTFTTEGFAVLSCANFYCSDSVKVTLPKVEAGKSAVVESEATELHPEILKYTYTSELYGFTVELKFESGTALSHDYHYEIMPNEKDTGKMDLIGKCSQPECQTPLTRVENIETTFEDTSTCVKVGKLIWTYVHEGETLTFTSDAKDFASHTYSYDKSKVQLPTLDSNGLVVLYCSNKGCDHEQIVELPKVEIGVNAEIGLEMDGFILVEYTHSTEYGVKIEVTILIYPEK